ncbi:MAG: helix-hairpin-helix domain-containing protein [Lactobacillus mulieris]|jgi:competence protein comEA helix-hairpin-helix repeat region|uniref:Helix-hairpin-helix domain-containing protein n=1 Tax=Lactobacillus mulieris TaxID=2508708 RepID=A0AAP3GXR7_9LACO|nr:MULTISPECIES: helix-hairpin-helix domain-containing protein [Lactobacillus]EFH29267.1 comEA protein [Lactobacillus jensenii JV-V16]KAA9245346.1 ComEA family DNA-binding protein [Lactobacillus jensenii]MCF1796893.1 helix-hairpin-helix domain-containing protein [Lactobacillus mulieris]MCT7674115.1 helix-hairpin-helix domain-containing protein [Lactobacillus mulieris]MCT7772614.1 helix-hairpin-helix domain-containing protein [Lactobacillus mulieris]
MIFEEFKDWIIKYKVWVIVSLLGIGILIFWKFNSNSQDELVSINSTSATSASQSNSLSSSAVSNVSASKNDKVTCDISGAVKNSGIYALKAGARVADLIRAAGGETAEADLSSVNRAILLKDQDKVYIPVKGENSPLDTTASQPSSTTSNNGGEKIHLNSATIADLQKLNGVGQKKAEQIIAYREQNGPFKSVDDLTKVSGIGEKTLAGFKDQLEL